jgi:hypothetical protein
MTIEQCSQCGYLAVKSGDTGEWREAPGEYRESGVLPIPLAKSAISVPLCFVRAFDLRAEYESHPTVSREQKAAKTLSVLQQSRDCGARGKSVSWTQGFDPKEHLQMQMLEEQRNWQRTEAADQRTWQAKEAEKADTRHNDNLKAVIEAGRSNVRSAIVAAVIGAIATLIVGAVSIRLATTTLPTPLQPPVVQPGNHVGN